MRRSISFPNHDSDRDTDDEEEEDDDVEDEGVQIYPVDNVTAVGRASQPVSDPVLHRPVALRDADEALRCRIIRSNKRYELVYPFLTLVC